VAACGLLDYALERTTARVIADDARLSIARVTLSTGVAEGLAGELGGGLVLVGLKFELGDGLDGWLDAFLVTNVTVGELNSRAVVAAVPSPAAWVDVSLAAWADLVETVDPGGGHVCVGQATMGLRVTLLLGLPVWRIRTTASAVTSTVGRITAQK
jgi:hypothetical protein